MPVVVVSSPPRLLALHGLRLRGTAEPADIAELLAGDADAIATSLADAVVEGLVSYEAGRFSGYHCTDAGRDEAARLVAAELDDHDLRADVAGVYERFLTVNGALLEVCTDWQLRAVDGQLGPNDHRDAGYDLAVIGRLAGLHQSVSPVLDDLAALLARFEGHRRRLGTALAHVQAGDHDWFTKPMFPSYHSTWFELHEDLLATLGMSRREGS